jgi:hypothetical protein
MNEFEWHRQLRDLRQPQLPPRDLWPSIDAALHRADAANDEAAKAPRQRRRRLLVAASLAASALLVAGTAWQLWPPRDARPAVRGDIVAAPNWKPSDPRLTGAAVEFTAARMELQQALQQAPDSPALQRLLVRTRQQQAQWQGRTRDAG